MTESQLNQTYLKVRQGFNLGVRFVQKRKGATPVYPEDGRVVDPVTGKDVFREDYLESLLDRVDDADVAHGVLALTSGRYFRQVTF